jgi:hypothetical protein
MIQVSLCGSHVNFSCFHFLVPHVTSLLRPPRARSYHCSAEEHGPKSKVAISYICFPIAPSTSSPGNDLNCLQLLGIILGSYLSRQIASAPALLIVQVMAFVAPKIIGGVTAPSPVGELGFVEMTQAMNLSDVKYQTVGALPYFHPR